MEKELSLAKSAIRVAESDLAKSDDPVTKVKEAQKTLEFYRKQIDLVETIRSIAREEAKEAIKEAFGDTE